MFINSFSLFLRRHFSSATKLPNLTKIPPKYRNLAVREAQKALTDYLHATRCFPYAYAHHIATNSSRSLTNLISNVPFSPSSSSSSSSFSSSSISSTFSRSFDKFLRYHPINEFEFFFESIGIDYDFLSGFLPPDKLFFSEDGTLLDAACALFDFGFPWDKLGVLYMGRSSIFRTSAAELKSRLYKFKGYGFGNFEVIGICLAFPFVLCQDEGQMGAEIDGLFTDLKLVFLDFGLARSVEGSVDSWHEVCRKLRVFYNLNVEKGKLVEILGRNKSFILEHSEEDLIKTAEYFCRFGVKEEEVAQLILKCPELLNLDLEMPVINVLKILKHLGMSSKDLKDVGANYAHVLGRNKMANLPNVMRALDLQEWFFNKVKHGRRGLLVDCITSHPNEVQDKDYVDGLKKIHMSRARFHNLEKLNFLHCLGFGENALTMNVFNHLSGTSGELQKRFDYLLCSGIKYSKVCKMIRMTPKFLSQNRKIIEQKVNFICQEMGNSLELLQNFPAVLCFDLDHRIKPRHRFHMWLIEKGLPVKNYSFVSIIATSEKRFVSRAFRIHPAAPKHWFEQFYSRNC